jgi:hypothetical protein
VSPEVLFCILSAFAGAAAGWAAGFEKGRTRGIAEGWNEHREECVARDRARRQRNGQFRARETLSENPKQ